MDAAHRKCWMLSSLHYIRMLKHFDTTCRSRCSRTTFTLPVMRNILQDMQCFFWPLFSPNNIELFLMPDTYTTVDGNEEIMPKMKCSHGARLRPRPTDSTEQTNEWMGNGNYAYFDWHVKLRKTNFQIIYFRISFDCVRTQTWACVCSCTFHSIGKCSPKLKCNMQS